MFKNKTIKLFLILGVILFSLVGFIGCSDKESKINVNFIIDGKSHLLEIDKGTSISKDMIPLSIDEEVVGLYYDENMKNEYDGKVLNDDFIIYVKTDVKINDDIIKKMKSKYVSEYLLKYNENASIDEVHVDKFYGVYNNAYVLIMSNDYVEYLSVMTYEVVLNYRFEYPNNNLIKVYYDDSFYTLTSAYLNNILSKDDITHIYEKFVK